MGYNYIEANDCRHSRNAKKKRFSLSGSLLPLIRILDSACALSFTIIEGFDFSPLAFVQTFGSAFVDS